MCTTCFALPNEVPFRCCSIEKVDCLVVAYPRDRTDLPVSDAAELSDMIKRTSQASSISVISQTLATEVSCHISFPRILTHTISFRQLSNVDLTCDSRGDQGRAAFLKKFDGSLGFRQ